MGSLLFLYFLHPITTRLANKTQRFNPRYELTNPTKNPPSPFAFSLLSVILRHLYYTLQPPSTLFPIPFSLCYYPPSSCYPVSSYPVSPLLILCYYPLFSCYPVSSSPVTIPCSFVTQSPLPMLLPPVPLLLCLLLPCLSSPHPLLLLLCSFVTLSPHLLLLSSVPLLLCLPLPCLLIPCRVKNVYLSHPQGPLLCPRQGLSSMQNMPFLPLEDALLACRTCPSWRHVFKSLIVRRLR